MWGRAECVGLGSFSSHRLFFSPPPPAAATWPRMPPPWADLRQQRREGAAPHQVWLLRMCVMCYVLYAVCCMLCAVCYGLWAVGMC